MGKMKRQGKNVNWEEKYRFQGWSGQSKGEKGYKPYKRGKR